MKSKIKRSLIVGIIVGLTFPYGWIIFTGESRIVDESKIDYALVSHQSGEELKEYMAERMRPMTVIEKITTSVPIVVALWKYYALWSLIITLFVFFINYFIWPMKQEKP